MKKIAAGTFSMSASKLGELEGLDRKYMSVQNKREPTYKKDNARFEAGVIPSGPSIYVKGKKEKQALQNPYEQLINARFNANNSPNNYPSVTFEARELYDQANFLS